MNRSCADSAVGPKLSIVNGRRDCEIPHTPGHLNCPACFESANLHVRNISPSMSFAEASDCFLGSLEAPNPAIRAQYVAPRTLRDLKAYCKTLKVFFGQLPLDQIHLGNFIEYQRARSIGDGFTRKRGERVEVSIAGPNKINHELQVMVRVLRLAGCWQGPLPGHSGRYASAYAMALERAGEKVSDLQYYRPLQTQESEFEPALSPEQQEEFLRVAASNPEWHPVWWYAIVALHTTFSSDEMRTIRQGDVNLAYQILGVNRRFGKNTYRRRDIPITDGACVWALQRLLERAGELAGNAPHLFLFPGRLARGHWDGEKHMSETGFRRAFSLIRKQAGVPWFRWNGFRHTAITRLAEDGVPIAIIKRRAGHISNEMSEHYTHISEQAERMQLERASQRKPVVSIRASPVFRERAARA